MTTTDDSLDMTLMGAADHLSWLLAEAERPDATPADIAWILAGVRDLKAQAGEVYAQVEQILLANMGEKRLEVEGLGVVESKRKTKRTKWEHDEVFRHVIARIIDDPYVLFDPEEGAALPPAQQAANIVGRLREVLSPSWKVTGLRAMGLTPDEFCEETEDGWGIQLPSRKVEG